MLPVGDLDSSAMELDHEVALVARRVVATIHAEQGVDGVVDLVDDPLHRGKIAMEAIVKGWTDEDLLYPLARHLRVQAQAFLATWRSDRDAYRAPLGVRRPRPRGAVDDQ